MTTIRFFGGKGGVGKTTLAAAFALSQSRGGFRTLVVSTDPAHSLGDVLDTPLEDEPSEVLPKLWAAELSGQRQAQRRVAEVAEDARHTVPAEIMPAVERHLARAAESPGTVESALLDRLTEFVELIGTRWDQLIVDSAPTGHMLRLLTLPALLTPWIEGLASQRKQARAPERMAAGLFSPADDEPDPLLERLHARRARLERLRARLTDEALVHLVLVPEHLPLRETLRTAETLTDSGLRLGRVLVNRIVPDDETGVLAERHEQQDDVLTALDKHFADIGQLYVPLLPGRITGPTELATVAGLLSGSRTAARSARTVRSAPGG